MDTPSLQLRADRERLLAAVAAADAVVPTTSTKPIQTHLLLEGKDGRVEVTASDSQVGMRAVVSGIEIQSAGAVVVQSRQLAMILKESSSPSVEMQVLPSGDSVHLAIRLSDGDYTLPLILGETLPPVSFFPADAKAISLPGKRFEHMLRQTSFAMDKDRSSPVLSGLLVSITAGELCLAATDGKVLAEAVEKDPSFAPPEGENFQAVLPFATITHLTRILGSGQPDRVQLAFAQKLVFARLRLSGDLTVDLTSRLVEGSFPAYRMAISGTATNVVTFDTPALASAVRRVSLMITAANRAVVLRLEKDKAVLENLPGVGGNARIPLVCQYGGNPVRLGINAAYLADVLRIFGGERLAIELGRGLIMREPGATYLVMPISLPS
ncbi:MAG: DNA polymerase III subunit beta [Planctomycetes bacterium]|nr:DNA polymerase III subunit beta [Planctomycetota bacterium]